MASFGHVLNLLDDRYLNLHDVVGNVEPMPTLVPYREYAHSVLVLRMDTNHELFMGLMHEFTARIAQETRTELWTWFVQWEIDSHEVGRLSASAPSPKKPRLEADKHKTEPSEQHMQPRAPIVDVFERCVINAELMKEEDLLRILIDIVQVDSSIVPNFIEFLYRWIDYYEGDGTALKAALKWEIPSLWDFEHHPLVLPADIKKQMEKDKAEKGKEREAAMNEEQTGSHVKRSRAQDLAQGSPTKKMRQKPDLVAMERDTQESERLQYREVRYGIQPPKLKLPMSPLINIPRDQAQRLKYYAACFKSRYRALVHLMEAGLSMQQISNYQKLQEEHPKDTPETLEKGDPKELKGLRHYYKDADAAQGIHQLREKLQLRREKQKEIAISSRLAVEAQLAAATSTAGAASGIPLIPPTPSYTRTPDMAADMLRRIQTAKFTGPERINFVPTPLVGKMRSNLFEGAKDSQSLPTGIQPDLTLPREVPIPRPDHGEDLELTDEIVDDSDEESIDVSDEGSVGDGDSSDSDDGSRNDRDDLSGSSNQASALSAIAQNSGAQTLAGGFAAGVQQHHALHMAGTAIPSPLHGRLTANGNALFQQLAPEQAHSLLPLVNTRSQREVAANIAMHVSSIEAPMSDIADERALNQALPQMHTATIAPSSLMTRNTNTVMTAGASQSGSASLPYLPPPPIRPPPVALPPRENGPNLPFLLPTNHPPAHDIVSSGLRLPLSGQHPASCQSHDQPPAPSPHQPSPLNFNLGQVPPRTLLGLPTPVQVLRPQHDSSRASATRPLPATHFPPVPRAPGLVAPTLRGEFQHVLTRTSPVSGPQTGGLEYRTATSYMQDLPHAGSMLPPPTPGHPQGTQLSKPNTSEPLQRATNLTPLSSNAVVEHQIQLAPPPPSGPNLSPPRPGIQRKTPAPLDLPPALHSPSPFSSLAPSLLATTPFLPTPQGIPIQIYFPKIVIPGNGIGPSGRRLGTDGITETDALLVGHTHPGTGKITLSKALFLPLGVWKNTMNRVHKNAYSVLETYAAPPGHPGLTGKFGAVGSGPCHAAVYKKLEYAYNMMRCSSAKQREVDLTKRWRASKGPMTQQDRGAVWEGYGVTLDSEIEMSAKDRDGALMYSWLVDEGVEKKPDSRKSVEELELEKRWEELEELEREEEEMGIDWDEEFAMMDGMEIETVG